MAIAYTAMMKHVPVSFPRDATDRSVQDGAAGQVDAWIEALSPHPGNLATDEQIAASQAQARADFAEGRFYGHDVVKEWLDSRDPGVSFKEWILKRDG